MKKWAKSKWAMLTKERHLNFKQFTIVASTIIAAGCATPKILNMATPMPVPPGVEAMGYNIPDIMGISTIGIVQATYEWEVIKLEAFRGVSAAIIEPITEARDEMLPGILIALGIPAAGVAGARLKRKEDYTEEEYQQAKAEVPTTSEEE